MENFEDINDVDEADFYQEEEKEEEQEEAMEEEEAMEDEEEEEEEVVGQHRVRRMVLNPTVLGLLGFNPDANIVLEYYNIINDNQEEDVDDNMVIDEEVWEEAPGDEDKENIPPNGQRQRR